MIQELLNLLKLHKDKLERYCSIINLQREIETLTITIKHLQSGKFFNTYLPYLSSK
jgi:Lon protease-like protein